MWNRIIVAFFILLTTKLHAGTWPQGKGKGYAQISNTFLSYDGIINGYTFTRQDVVSGLKRRVRDYSLQGYLEYGISDRFTTTLILPFKILATSDQLQTPSDDLYPRDTIAAGRLNAFGNVEIGGSYLINGGKYVLSAELFAGLPAALYQHSTGLRSGYDCTFLSPKISIGRGFKNYYFSSSWGYRLKTNNYADDLIAANEIGYNIKGKKRHAWLIFVLGAMIPVTQGNHQDRNSVHTGLYRDEEGFVDFGLKLNYYLHENLSLNAASRGALWARHGGNAVTFSLGLAWDW